MKLWTMQTRDVWESLQRAGVFRCDTALCWMAADFPRAYAWLAREMTKRVGPPPQGVDWPVWAWYMQNGKHKKPDLRSERWGYGSGDEDYCCIELEIAPKRVLLSDFDNWHIVLCNGLISDTEEEDVALEAFYEQLSDEEKITCKEKNWERVLEHFPTQQRLDDARRMGAGHLLGTQARGCPRRALFPHRQVQAPSRSAMRGVPTERKSRLLSCQRKRLLSLSEALNPPTARARR